MKTEQDAEIEKLKQEIEKLKQEIEGLNEMIKEYEEGHSIP